VLGVKFNETTVCFLFKWQIFPRNFSRTAISVPVKKNFIPQVQCSSLNATKIYRPQTFDAVIKERKQLHYVSTIIAHFLTCVFTSLPSSSTNVQFWLIIIIIIIIQHLYSASVLCGMQRRLWRQLRVREKVGFEMAFKCL